MKQSIKVLVADDHQVVRAGIVALLEQQEGFQVVGEAGTGDEAVEKALAKRPDVVLMDLQMPGTDGVQATRILRERAPEVAVLVLTTFDDDELIWGAIQAGAKGYLLKDTPPAGLFSAVRDVAAGKTLIAPEVLARLTQVIQQGGPGPQEEPLTEREHEILQLIAKGYSNKEIAAALFISDNTVKTHISNLFDKLGVRDRTEAVTKALRLGWLKL
ncbi:MAG: response regulator transcription factor [Firmicutes bacterium]|jgi:DNA-binding NarL/FixJ family response regulator|nr:response regulator transcription factor [Bacillota bacterium]